MTAELKQKIFLELLNGLEECNTLLPTAAAKIEMATKIFERFLKAFEDEFESHGNGD